MHTSLLAPHKGITHGKPCRQDPLDHSVSTVPQRPSVDKKVTSIGVGIDFLEISYWKINFTIYLQDLLVYHMK